MKPLCTMRGLAAQVAVVLAISALVLGLLPTIACISLLIGLTRQSIYKVFLGAKLAGSLPTDVRSIRRHFK